MTDNEMTDQIARGVRDRRLRYVLEIMEPLLEYADAAADAPLDWAKVVKAREFVKWAKAELGDKDA